VRLSHEGLDDRLAVAVSPALAGASGEVTSVIERRQGLILRDPEVCPKCAADSRVVNTRAGTMSRKRRRECLACAYRWNTYESLINPDAIRLRDHKHP
jgi:DNA-directed RNA polymerase subunit M/transcription elongation factor TFIIS